MLIISEYLKKWKEALNSFKIEFPENELVTLKAEVFGKENSEESALSPLEIESAKKFEKAIEVSEKDNSKKTLREYYGFKRQNYDCD